MQARVSAVKSASQRAASFALNAATYWLTKAFASACDGCDCACTPHAEHNVPRIRHRDVRVTKPIGLIVLVVFGYSEVKPRATSAQSLPSRAPRNNQQHGECDSLLRSSPFAKSLTQQKLFCYCSHLPGR